MFLVYKAHAGNRSRLWVEFGTLRLEDLEEVEKARNVNQLPTRQPSELYNLPRWQFSQPKKHPFLDYASSWSEQRNKKYISPHLFLPESRGILFNKSNKGI